MRQFGQNERSLFSFVSSSEPMALQQHAAQPAESAGHYRIHHLFDYVRLNLLPTVTTGHSHTHWGVIEAVLASTPRSKRRKRKRSSRPSRCSAFWMLLTSPPLRRSLARQSAVRGRLSMTRSRRCAARGVIYERGTVKGLCLWPHTSVNLDELFAKASRSDLRQRRRHQAPLRPRPLRASSPARILRAHRDAAVCRGETHPGHRPE